MATPVWVSLFSGGKDSSYALYLAIERGLSVGRLLTVHPPGDSYMYHTPATDVASLAAESIGIPVVDVTPMELNPETVADPGAQGDAELAPLADALDALTVEIDAGLAGLIVGAVESEYQASRIESLAADRDVDVFAPLWRRNPPTLVREMLAAGFEIRFVRVAAGGLDASWLGRTLDSDALAALEQLRETHGVHVLGEGGEYETLVTDGPHMERRIEIESRTTWDGTRGRLHVEDARLVSRDA